MLDSRELQTVTPSAPTVLEMPLRLGADRQLPVRIDVKAHDATTGFALSVRKSGSSLFSNLVRAIALAADRNVVDIPAAAFSANLRYRDWNLADALRPVIWPGNIYVGFRDAPSALCGDKVFEQAVKLLLLRDPRDVLVSEFFSNAYSHSLPDGEGDSVVSRQRKIALTLGIGPYVLSRVEALNVTIRDYLSVLRSRGVSVMRYEDVIFDKPAWLERIATALGLPLDPDLKAAILGWSDIRPTEENPEAFVRRVAPGDHLDKLTTETTLTIEAALDPIWWDEPGYRRTPR